MLDEGQPDGSITRLAASTTIRASMTVRRRDRPDRTSRASGSRSWPTAGLPSKGPGPCTRWQLRADRARARSPRPRLTPNKSKPVELQTPTGRFQPGWLTRSPRPPTATRNDTRRAGWAVSLQPRASSTGRPSRPRKPVGKPGGTVLTCQDCTTSSRGQRLSARPVPAVRSPKMPQAGRSEPCGGLPVRSWPMPPRSGPKPAEEPAARTTFRSMDAGWRRQAGLTR